MTKKIDTTGFEKEELIQNYLQYRWLDDTRSKLIDRVYILVAALIFARLQFSSVLLENKGWLLLLHVIFIIISITFAYSIVRYRRQQRGHGEYIKACRNSILQISCLGKYKSFTEGRSIYLTFGAEASVVLISLFSPFVIMIDHCAWSSFITTEWLAFVVIRVLPFLVMVLVLCVILVPFLKYNFKETLDWNKD